MNNYTFYEYIACHLTGVYNPEVLFTKTREANATFARMMCMVFRRRYLKMTYPIIGKRYNRDHTTAMHAEKVIDLYKETNDVRGKIYNEFLIKCKEELKCIDDRDNDGAFKIMLLEKISSHGFQEYKEECCLLFEQICQTLKEKDCDENHMRKLLEEAHIRVIELKFLYE